MAWDIIVIIIGAILLVIDIYYVGYTDAIRKVQRKQREKQERELERKLDKNEEARLMYEGDLDDDTDDGIGY